MSGREARTDLRVVESHASWRDVYYELGANPDQHEVSQRERD